MTRRRVVAALLGCLTAAAATTGIAAAGAARAAAPPSTVVVPDSAVPAVAGATLLGATPASRPLSVQVWLTPDLTAAAAFANAVATPGSPLFHRYLSPGAYTARFGASAAQAAAVASWLASRGLTGVRADGGRDYVSATGPVAAVQSAFGVRIDQYRVAGGDGGSAAAFANDRAVSVPAALAPDVLGVTGLNSIPPTISALGQSATPASAPTAAKAPTCSHYWAQYERSFRPAYRALTRGVLPVCGYSAAQLRAVYGATPAATVKGQTVALTETGPPTAMAQTLTDFAKANYLPAPRRGQYRQQEVDRTCPAASAAVRPADNATNPPKEAEMDSEAVYAMAPGASQLLLYSNCLSDQSLLDTILTVLKGNGRRPSATIVSDSWDIYTSVPPKTVHAIALRAAAEGVGVYFSSADFPGVAAPTDDPYITAVGGSTLGIGAKRTRVFETGWSDDSGLLAGGTWSDIGITGAGGGASALYGQPAYQKGVVPLSMSRVRVGKRVVMRRAVPDIAADADTDTGMTVGYIASVRNGRPSPYQTTLGSGTSLACPLIAGLVADAQQGRKAAFGFINPLLYRLARTPAIADVVPVTAKTPLPYRDAYTPRIGLNSPQVDVFDSQERAYTSQVTATGYDTMTGIGTPNGRAFIAGLRRTAAAAEAEAHGGR